MTSHKLELDAKTATTVLHPKRSFQLRQQLLRLLRLKKSSLIILIVLAPTTWSLEIVCLADLMFFNCLIDHLRQELMV